MPLLWLEYVILLEDFLIFVANVIIKCNEREIVIFRY